MISSGILIFVAFVCAVMGFAIGGVVVYLSGSGKGSKADTAKKQEDKAEQPKSPYQEIIRLVRDPANGKILTEMNGQILPPSKDLDEERRKMLLQLAREWVDWLGYRNNPPPSAQPQPPAQTARTPTPPPSGSLLKRAAASSINLTTEPIVEPIPAVPVFFPTRSAEPRPAPKSIVGQIDDILQEMLAKHSMQELAIRLAEEPQQGVIVWVGTTRYIGIDTVTDPRIKAVVRAAVSEWERRSGK